MGKKKQDGALLTGFRAGIIGLVFLVLGFQLAIFLYKGAELKILANRDSPDTVFVVEGHITDYEAVDFAEDGCRQGVAASSGRKMNSNVIARSSASHSRQVEAIRENAPPGRVENFCFNPNTVSVEDLVRLGFSPKQAQSIDNYRVRGGRFRRKEDFAKSFVVADSVYRRLEPYIDIPKIDLNRADSSAFDSLPGIGGYFAAKMVSYREALGGYSCKEQLTEIYHFDTERFNALKDLVCVSPAPAFRLWTLPADSLRLHPHIRSLNTARAVILYRENNAKEALTVDGLEAAGVLTAEQAAGLRRCRIAPPP